MQKKCQKCKYRGSSVNGCDYIIIKGISRNMSVEDCTLYKEGARKNALQVRKKSDWKLSRKNLTNTTK